MKVKRAEEAPGSVARRSRGQGPDWLTDLTTSPGFTVLVVITLFVVGCWLAGGVP